MSAAQYAYLHTRVSIYAGQLLDPARLLKAERLFAGGYYDLALPEYLAIYREADPLLNDRLAAIYLQKGEAAAAAKFYDRNLASAPPFGRNAIVGLVRAGLAMASPELVLQHLPALLELPPEETRAELLGVARFAASQGRHELAPPLECFQNAPERHRRHPMRQDGEKGRRLQGVIGPAFAGCPPALKEIPQARPSRECQELSTLVRRTGDEQGASRERDQSGGLGPRRANEG